MNNGLKIFACSGLQQDTAETKTGFQSEGTVAVENTRAMNGMLAKINLAATKIRRLSLSTFDKVKEYNNLVMYSVCFYYARLYRDDVETLKALAPVFAKAFQTGMFLSTSTDASEREAMVNDIIAKMDAMLEAGNINYASSEASWWNTNITNQSVIGLPEDVRNYISGVGATVVRDYGELNKYLYDGGTYFLYLYMTDQQVAKSTYAIRKKRRKQQEVYEYCRNCFCYEYGGIYGNEQDMVEVITAGIIEDFGVTPEDVISDILSGKRSDNGIGQLSPIVIAAIISAVGSVVLGIITAICNYAAQVAVAKYAMPDDLEDGLADENDWEGLNAKNNQEENKSMAGISPLLLGGAALALLAMNNKN